MFNASTGFYGTFSAMLDTGLVKPGAIGIVSQSGAYGSHLMYLARLRGLGMSYMITTGNECDIDVAEALRSLTDDDGLSPCAREAYERLGNVGAMNSMHLRQSLRLEGQKGSRRFSKTLVELYRRLLICNVGVDGSETRWPAAVIDRVDHAFRFKRLARDKAEARLGERLKALDPRVLRRLASGLD